MSEEQDDSEEGPRFFLSGGQLPPDAARGLMAALEEAAGTHVPTTLEYRLKALEFIVMATHNGKSFKIESVEQLISSARKLELYLRENGWS